MRGSVSLAFLPIGYHKTNKIILQTINLSNTLACSNNVAHICTMNMLVNLTCSFLQCNQNLADTNLLSYKTAYSCIKLKGIWDNYKLYLLALNYYSSSSLPVGKKMVLFARVPRFLCSAGIDKNLENWFSTLFSSRILSSFSINNGLRGLEAK